MCIYTNHIYEKKFVRQRCLTPFCKAFQQINFELDVLKDVKGNGVRILRKYYDFMSYILSIFYCYIMPNEEKKTNIPFSVTEEWTLTEPERRCSGEHALKDLKTSSPVEYLIESFTNEESLGVFSSGIRIVEFSLRLY